MSNAKASRRADSGRAGGWLRFSSTETEHVLSRWVAGLARTHLSARLGPPVTSHESPVTGGWPTRCPSSFSPLPHTARGFHRDISPRRDDAKVSHLFRALEASGRKGRGTSVYPRYSGIQRPPQSRRSPDRGRSQSQRKTLPPGKRNGKNHRKAALRRNQEASAKWRVRRRRI